MCIRDRYYSNVSDEHMIAMTVAAIQLHREQELIEALTKEQARIRAENGLPQRDRFCGIMIDCLTRGVMPFSEGNKNAPYCEPEEPQTREQLWEQIKSKNKKLTPDDSKGKAKLFYLCCLYGSAKDEMCIRDSFKDDGAVPGMRSCPLWLPKLSPSFPEWPVCELLLGRL